MKKKILIISDSIKRKTGYATVARNLIKNLLPTEKYEIAQLGLADVPSQLEFKKIDYYSALKDHSKCCGKGIVIEHRPSTSPEIEYIVPQPDLQRHPDQKPCVRGQQVQQDHYAYDSVYFVIQDYKPDIVIPINDLWGLYNITHLRNRTCFKFIPYLAIDSECLFPVLNPPQERPGLPPIQTVPVIGSTDKTVVFTDWAQGVINRTSEIVSKGKVLSNMVTIPHGVNTSIWKPLDNKEELRQKYFKLDSDTFLVGSVARNQPRKRLDAVFQTMRKYIDTYEKAGKKKIMVYFHCSLDDNMGWDLNWLSAYYGVGDRCIFDKNLKPGVGPTDEDLNEIVNCFDAHLSLTNSEGWHLPALETAAAGIPNVITKYSAHADWGKDTHLFCKVAGYEHEPRTGFVKAIADTNDAAKQLSLLASSKEMWKEYSKKGIRLGKKLDWAKVCEQWVELLDAIDTSDLKEGRYSAPEISLPPKNPNPNANQGNQSLQLRHFPNEKPA